MRACQPTIDFQRLIAAELPDDDGQDLLDAQRGFLATTEHAEVIRPDGHVIWSQRGYGLLDAEQPAATVNPSFDHRATHEQITGRPAVASTGVAADVGPPGVDAAAPAGPGRPRLGVVAREITLLPRHWLWLNSQPGGASVALRKLVEQARRANQAKEEIRQSQEASYRFMSAMAGNLAGFEDAARALFASDRERFDALLAPWPKDVRSHLRQLAAAAFEGQPSLDAFDA